MLADIERQVLVCAAAGQPYRSDAPRLRLRRGKGLARSRPAHPEHRHQQLSTAELSSSSHRADHEELSDPHQRPTSCFFETKISPARSAGKELRAPDPLAAEEPVAASNSSSSRVDEPTHFAPRSCATAATYLTDPLTDVKVDGVHGQRRHRENHAYGRRARTRPASAGASARRLRSAWKRRRAAVAAPAGVVIHAPRSAHPSTASALRRHRLHLVAAELLQRCCRSLISPVRLEAAVDRSRLAIADDFEAFDVAGRTTTITLAFRHASEPSIRAPARVRRRKLPRTSLGVPSSRGKPILILEGDIAQQ